MARFNLNKALLRKQVESNVRIALVISGTNLTRTIKASMIPGGGGKVTYKGRMHVRSSPNQPPSPMSGRLRDSVHYITSFGVKSPLGPMAKKTDRLSQPKETGAMVVSVGTNAEYALAIEKGYRPLNLKKRPYLWPALKGSREMIKDAFTRE